MLLANHHYQDSGTTRVLSFGGRIAPFILVGGGCESHSLTLNEACGNVESGRVHFSQFIIFFEDFCVWTRCQAGVPLVLGLAQRSALDLGGLVSDHSGLGTGHWALIEICHSLKCTVVENQDC